MWIITLLFLTNIYCKADNAFINKIIILPDEDYVNITGDVNIEDSSYSIEKIDSKEFKNKFISIPNLLETYSGIQTKEQGGLGTYSSISLRGSNSNQVSVLIDGVPLNDASVGSVNLSNISLNNVEFIEIYKGSSPVNYGISGIGGLVNIVTNRNVKEKDLNIKAGAASFNTYLLSASYSRKINNLYYLLGNEFQTSKNNFKFNNDNGTTWNLNDDKIEKRVHNAFKQNNFIGKIRYSFTPDLELIVSDMIFIKSQELPAWNNAAINTKLNTDRNILYVDLISNNIAGYNLNISNRIDYTYKNSVYYDPDNGIGLNSSHSKYLTNRIGYRLFAEKVFNSQIPACSVNVSKEFYNIHDLLNISDDGSSVRTGYSLAVEDNIYMFDDSLIISPSFTFDNIVDKLNSSYENNGVLRSAVFTSRSFFSPKFGVRYKFNSDISLKSNIALYKRDPTFFELFGDHGYFKGNYSLVPEKGTNFDFGFDMDYYFMSFNSVFYYRSVKDIISYVYDARGIGRAINISGAVISGIESDVFLILYKQYLKMDANYTWQTTTNKSTISSINIKKLPGHFEHSIFIKLNFLYSIFSTYLSYLYESGMYYDSPNLLKAPDKRVVNFGVDINRDFVLLSFEIRNLFNKQYEDFNGFPNAGRSFWISFRVGL